MNYIVLIGVVHQCNYMADFQWTSRGSTWHHAYVHVVGQKTNEETRLTSPHLDIDLPVF